MTGRMEGLREVGGGRTEGYGCSRELGGMK